MNTPEPCCKCGNFYYDCMTIESPNNYTECMDRSGKAKWGEKDCPQFTTKQWWGKDE